MTDAPTQGQQNPNRNSLEGMSCPKCGSFGPFRIAATTWATVSDEGTEDHTDVEWDDTSACVCVDCHHAATVLAFSEEGREAGK